MGHSPPRVLVVSDDPESAAVVRDILGVQGYTMGGVTNVQLTLEQLDVSRPDLIVLDMFTPVLEAWPILDELLRATAPPPLVCLTPRSVSPGALAALTFHTRGHLSKPFAATALVRLCESVIGARPGEVKPTAEERRREPRHRFVGEATLLTELGRPSLVLQVLEVSGSGAKIEIGAILGPRLVPDAKVRLVVTLLPRFVPTPVTAHIQWREDGIMGVSFEGAGLPPEVVDAPPGGRRGQR
jgi:two-component system copper resistance phosphate regulon response regulator CusR